MILPELRSEIVAIRIRRLAGIGLSQYSDSRAKHPKSYVHIEIKNICRYENIPDSKSEINLPVVTITDFSSGEEGKEVSHLSALYPV